MLPLGPAIGLPLKKSNDRCLPGGAFIWPFPD
jgi:hypothetical protein